MTVTTLHKQHDKNLTELEILADDKLVATITVSNGWVDITYEKNVSDVGSYELLQMDESGKVIIDKPTLA